MWVCRLGKRKEGKTVTGRGRKERERGERKERKERRERKERKREKILTLGSIGFSMVGLVWLFACLSESQFLFNNLLILMVIRLSEFVETNRFVFFY
jgi:hypothetical protein